MISSEELRGTGVRLLALCPGAVRTEIEVFAHNEGLLGLPSLAAEQVVKAGLRALEQGRVVKVVGGLNSFGGFWGRFRRLNCSATRAARPAHRLATRNYTLNQMARVAQQREDHRSLTLCHFGTRCQFIDDQVAQMSDISHCDMQ